MNLVYARMEMIRLFRNRQNLIFSLIFPLALFYAIAGANKNTDIGGGITFARYYFAAMVAFGGMAAVLAGGARIAFERQVGWNRQLRITPLTPRVYLSTKVITSYLVALLALLLVSVAALTLGVKFAASEWFETVGLVLVALIPFAALGIMLGHLVKGDAMGPFIGGGISLFSILGGAYFPIGGDSGFLHDFVRVIPSFWLVQAGKTGVGGEHWTGEAWIVVAVWSAATAAGAVWAYRRDTKRA